MSFALLGSLSVADEAGERIVAGARQRAVLACLLVRANTPVSCDALIDAAWDGNRLSGSATMVRSVVMRLRKALGPSLATRIIAHPPGYLIRVGERDLDLLRFEALCEDAGAALREGAWAQASGAAGQALALWRGAPLLDVPSDVLRDQVVPRLEQLRLQLLEDRAEAELHLGRHERLMPDLRDLAAAHPLRERFHAQLMLALYRCGRQAEALATYQDARQALVDELGIEPGAELRALHARILAGDRESASAAPPGPAGPGPAGVCAAAVPRQLPAAPGHFTGRQRELGLLTGLLSPSQQSDLPGGTVVISAIGGMAGVGKTALALHWAHQVAYRFDDGHLHVNLRGFGPSGTPVTPAEAVRGFLDALGVPPERIPASADAQLGLYRSLLAERKMLIVLDNARDEQQVRPLLPASPASLVVVTSRNQLTGLAVADGARLLSLDILTHDEAVQLLTARIGASRVGAEPGAIGEIAALCAHLPLALAVAAARAAVRPRFPLTELAAELRDTADPLDVLDAGDPAVSLQVALSWSYRQLGPDAARMFRLLGLHPGPDISIPAAGSLAGIDRAEARRLLRELTRDCLITEHVLGRYTFHDLLRAYAASKAQDCDPEPDRDAAIRRVLDHYLHSACHGCMLLLPSRTPLALAPPNPGTCPELAADHRQALAWFEAEHQVLLAAVNLAAETGADSHAWQLPCVMTPYLYRRGYWQERVAITASALAAATRLDDTLGQAASLRGLGSACVSTGNYDQGRAHLEQCLLLYQRLGDRMGEAWAQQNLAVLAEAQGRNADALDHSEQSLRLFQAIGHELAEAEMLANVGWCHAIVGDYQRARAFCEQALALTAKLGGSDFECHVWDTLGYIEHHLGNFSRAADHFEVALGLCRDHGHRTLEPEILTHIGDARHAAGELPQARQAWQQALAIYDDIHHPDAGKARAKLASTENNKD
jgi:DNA-binding SARP family transcriptional activator